MNRIDRLLAMIVYMQGRRVTRAEDMATYFEVSLRTVYRDLAALGESGVPVVGEPGMGYRIMKDYYLPPVMFTQEEVGAILVAGGLAERLTDQSIRGPMRAALHNILAILPRSGQDFVHRLGRRVGVRSLEGEDDKAWLTKLHTAVADHQVVRIKYRDGSDRSTQREVEPGALLFYGGRWHLVAWCRLRKDERDFRTDRIDDLLVLNERFTPRDFNLSDYLSRRQCDGDKYEAIIRFPRWGMNKVRRDWSTGLIREESDGDGVRATLSTTSLDWLSRWLLAFGPEVTIEAPQDLRAKVRELALETASMHER